nr:MAG TPA_asm: hypothetical protein [Caudoviricetes sp.]
MDRPQENSTTRRNRLNEWDCQLIRVFRESLGH